jgi:hypothetical protein
LERLPEALRVLQEVAKTLDTVFTLEVITKVPPEGEVPIVPVFKEMGLWHSINSKNNMGLGEPHYKFYEDEP